MEGEEPEARILGAWLVLTLHSLELAHYRVTQGSLAQRRCWIWAPRSRLFRMFFESSHVVHFDWSLSSTAGHDFLHGAAGHGNAGHGDTSKAKTDLKMKKTT